VHLSASYDDPSVVPPHVRDRYEWIETGSAAAILKATSPGEFADLVKVLDDFALRPDSWLIKGGNKGDIAAALDERFRALGWLETRIDVEVTGHFITDFATHGELGDALPGLEHEHATTSVYSEGFKVDNHKGRMIVDIEWNAKDGNLDRDLAAYRSWYEHGLINGAVIITKDRAPLLELAREVWANYQESLPVDRRDPTLPIDLKTPTTTSFDRAVMRVNRQGAGTCPVLIIGVGPAAWDGSPFTGVSGD